MYGRCRLLAAAAVIWNVEGVELDQRHSAWTMESKSPKVAVNSDETIRHAFGQPVPEIPARMTD